jgi:hypothetical protein
VDERAVEPAEWLDTPGEVLLRSPTSLVGLPGEWEAVTPVEPTAESQRDGAGSTVGESKVKLRGGEYVCALCGADLYVDEASLVTVIEGSSGKPNVRVLSVGGREIHRCEIRSRSGPRKP